jgi:hypothetical protein
MVPQRGVQSCAHGIESGGYKEASSGTVETWRGGLGGAYLLAAPFVWRCLTSPTLLRFHVPLIELGVRVSRPPLRAGRTVWA